MKSSSEHVSDSHPSELDNKQCPGVILASLGLTVFSCIIHTTMKASSSGKEEEKAFLGHSAKRLGSRGNTCCDKTSACTSAGVGGVGLVLLAILVLLAGPRILEKIILTNMALKEGSQMTSFWLNPPVEAQLTGYAFHVTNPEEVQRGAKPILEEIGPFVYNSVIVKDSKNTDTGKDSLAYNDDGETLTYRPRYEHVYLLTCKPFILDTSTR